MPRRRSTCYSPGVTFNPDEKPPQNRIQIAIGGIALAALWFVLCRHLSGEWSVNEQYSYGWFVPFFAAFLFWLRWEDRPMEGRAPSRPSESGTARRPFL